MYPYINIKYEISKLFGRERGRVGERRGGKGQYWTFFSQEIERGKGTNICIYVVVIVNTWPFWETMQVYAADLIVISYRNSIRVKEMLANLK